MSKALVGLGGCLMLVALPSLAAFKDAFTVPPPGWTGKVFKLSQSYPATLLAAGPHPWTTIDFKTTAGARY